MGRHRIYGITEDGEIKPRTYGENEPLKQAQSRYYQKNSETILKRNSEYIKQWKASMDINELKAKQKQYCAKYNSKKREEKRLKKLELDMPDEDKIAKYTELFDEIFKT